MIEKIYLMRLLPSCKSKADLMFLYSLSDSLYYFSFFKHIARKYVNSSFFKNSLSKSLFFLNLRLCIQWYTFQSVKSFLEVFHLKTTQCAPKVSVTSIRLYLNSSIKPFLCVHMFLKLGIHTSQIKHTWVMVWIGSDAVEVVIKSYFYTFPLLLLVPFAQPVFSILENLSFDLHVVWLYLFHLQITFFQH